MNVILILHALLVLVFTVRILLRDDISPPGRLAWFIVLNVLPYFGSVTYFLFGEIDIGKRTNSRYVEIFTEIKSKAAQFMGEPTSTSELIERIYQPAFTMLALSMVFIPWALTQRNS